MCEYHIERASHKERITCLWSEPKSENNISEKRLIVPYVIHVNGRNFGKFRSQKAARKALRKQLKLHGGRKFDDFLRTRNGGIMCTEMKANRALNEEHGEDSVFYGTKEMFPYRLTYVD